jgi:hypothetical protein
MLIRQVREQSAHLARLALDLPVKLPNLDGGCDDAVDRVVGRRPRLAENSGERRPVAEPVIVTYVFGGGHPVNRAAHWSSPALPHTAGSGRSVTLDTVTLARDEWLAVARELDTKYGEFAPPGLRARITSLLEQVPEGWGNEECMLEIDAAAAEVVRAIVRQGRGQSVNPDLERSQRQSISEANKIVRNHQHRTDE